MFPNIVVLLRDAAHIPRISVRDPLHLDDLYGEVWTELFDKRLRDDRVFTICISTSVNLPNLSTCAGMGAGVAGSDDQSVFLLVFLVVFVFRLFLVFLVFLVPPWRCSGCSRCSWCSLCSLCSLCSWCSYRSWWSWCSWCCSLLYLPY